VFLATLTPAVSRHLKDMMRVICSAMCAGTQICRIDFFHPPHIVLASRAEAS